MSARCSRGDLGNSVFSNRPVSADVRRTLPATIELTFTALLIATMIGIPPRDDGGGLVQSLFDHAVRVVTVGGLAVASFWFAIMLQMIFAMQLDWLPLRGRFPVGLSARRRPSPVSI